MTTGYKYDVFLSYRRLPPTQDWVKNHFYPLLKQWLPNFLPVEHKPDIFIDSLIDTGSAWPDELRQALKTSRCLLPIWSTEYFRSPWCLAEWRSMLRREKQLGLAVGKGAAGVIYPVAYVSNLDEFPPEARGRQCKDLEKWNSPHLSYKDTKDYNDLDKEVQNLCRELSQMIRRAPAWRNNFPLLLPKLPAKKVVVKLPKFKRAR